MLHEQQLLILMKDSHYTVHQSLDDGRHGIPVEASYAESDGGSETLTRERLCDADRSGPLPVAQL